VRAGRYARLAVPATELTMGFEAEGFPFLHQAQPGDRAQATITQRANPALTETHVGRITKLTYNMKTMTVKVSASGEVPTIQVDPMGSRSTVSRATRRSIATGSPVMRSPS